LWQNILDTQVNVPKRRKSQYAFTTIIGNAPHILWQNILDTQVNVPYTADNEKQVLINNLNPRLLVGLAFHQL